jgi:hypothetical protein
MPFLRICQDTAHEWGFRVPDYYVPSVGDILMLEYARPDEESEDVVRGVVVRRQFSFCSDFKEGNEIWCWVCLDEPIPDGYIADSTEWPALTCTQRAAKAEAYLEQLRKKKD